MIRFISAVSVLLTLAACSGKTCTNSTECGNQQVCALDLGVCAALCASDGTCQESGLTCQETADEDCAQSSCQHISLANVCLRPDGGAP